MGQQFELEGEMYVRTGPLVASHAVSGKQRFMARYVMVKPVGAMEAKVPSEERLLAPEAAKAAFEKFHERCQAALEPLKAELPAERMRALYAEIELARCDFLGIFSGN